MIARLETHGERFEVLVHPELAFKLKHGEDVDFEELLATEFIFKDARKGEKASEEAVRKILGEDFKQAVIKIIKKGEIQLTTEIRRKLIERKKRQIIDIIAKNAINPLTKTPHPPQRIEKALEEAKVHIDLNKSTEVLLKEVVKAIRPILPLKFEEKKIAVKIPAEYSAKAYTALRKYGELLQEEWLSDGSYACLLKLPAGVVEEFFRELNKITKGNVESRML